MQKRCARQGWRQIGALMAVVWLAAMPDPAAAADKQIKALQKRLDAIEAQVNGSAIRSSANDTSSTSAVLSRLNRIEETMRQLTGQVEKNRFLARQAGQKIDNLSADIVARLVALEEKTHALENAAQTAVAPADAPAASASPGGGDLPSGPDNLYAHAINLLLGKKEYARARTSFDLFLGQYPDHPKAGHALYWLGEANYLEGNYKAASQFYLESYSSYGSGPKAVDSLLKLGMSLSALGQGEQACSAFSELGERFPDAPQRITRRARVEKRRAGCDG